MDKEMEEKLLTLIEKCLKTTLHEVGIKSTCSSIRHDKRLPCSENCILEIAAQSSGWVKMKSSMPIPDNSVIAGYIPGGTLIYVGRVSHDRETLVGKAIQSDRMISFAAKDVEHKRDDYEMLTGNNYGWLPWHLGSVPPNAVLGGSTQNGEKLYIGRAYIPTVGELAVGYVRPSHHCLYVSAIRKVYTYKSFEILINLTENGETCSWINGKEKWLTRKIVPVNDVESPTSFVGRVFHDGEIIPAIVDRNRNLAIILQNDKVIEKSEFELLTGDGFCWEIASHGRIPPCAVAGGRTKYDEPLYIGRKMYLGEMRMGRIQQSQGCMFMIVGNQQLSVKKYEVLVVLHDMCMSCPNE